MDSIQFATSYLTFYLKGEVAFAEDHIGVRIPNTILGLIPLGSEQRTLDIKHIVAVSNNFRIKIGQLLIGILLASDVLSAPLCLLYGEPIAFIGCLIVGCLGILLALNSLQTTITIALASSQTVVLPLVIFEKGKAALIEQGINELLAARTYATNVRAHTDRSIADNQRQTDRIIAAINARQ